MEELLAEELESLGANNVQVLKRAVSFSADKELMYKSCLWLRTSLRIIKPIAEFQAEDEHQLYSEIQKIDWSQYLDKEGTLAVDSTVNSNIFRHSKYVALKTKDAIVDQFRDKFGVRPSVHVSSPDLRINLKISNKDCILSIDASGDAMFKRGYRVQSVKAPMNEVLAAGLLKHAGWTPDQPLIDPMCGSGTILIEAALMAKNVAPLSFRNIFGFMHWPDFDQKLWADIKADSVSQQKDIDDLSIKGSDISLQSIQAARENIAAANLEDDIIVSRKTFSEAKPQTDYGFLITNPPYGERLEDAQINAFYSKFGDQLKQEFNGFDAWIISSSQEALKNIRLRPSRRITLYNGSLECKFMKYEMYKGTKKTKFDNADN
ncbi:THUMP domain-containing protein [Chondrinema litorale]|nr:THUMP domain-containing protein [Chondrinema litorale]UZR93694.1 THUMP domain-containing protein [Chondrinema litorale]